MLQAVGLGLWLGSRVEAGAAEVQQLQLQPIQLKICHLSLKWYGATKRCGLGLGLGLASGATWQPNGKGTRNGA